jgi:hypothetical protein
LPCEASIRVMRDEEPYLKVEVSREIEKEGAKP